MRLLNLGCGGTRPPEPWVNVDTIIAQHRFIGPECDQLFSEPNYCEYDLGRVPWPWDANSVDGILASHFFEHMDAQEALQTMRAAYHVLAPGGVLRVSVPDCSYFRTVYVRDCRDNAEELFGEPIYDPAKSTFLDYALYFYGHKQTFCEASLWCLIANGGFTPSRIWRVAYQQTATEHAAHAAANLLLEHDNRARFSLYMEAEK